MGGNLETFLKGSNLAKRVPAEARVVVRRFAESPRAVETAIRSGRIEVVAQPIYELVVGDTLVARGEIVTEDGASRFRVTEVVE
jgi:hypothetical protein